LGKEKQIKKKDRCNVAKVITNNEEFVNTMLSLPKGTRVGYFNHYISATNREGFKKPSIGHLYLLSKMAEVCEKTFVVIVFLDRNSGLIEDELNTINLLKENSHLYPCDFIYFNLDQIKKGLQFIVSNPITKEIMWLIENTDLFKNYDGDIHDVMAFASNISQWKGDAIDCIIESYKVVGRITDHLDVVFCRGSKDMPGDLNVYGKIINGPNYPNTSVDKMDNLKPFLSEVVKSRRWIVPTFRYPNGVVASRVGFKKIPDHIFSMLDKLDFNNITIEELKEKIEDFIRDKEKSKHKVYYAILNMITAKEATNDDIKNKLAQIYVYRTSKRELIDGRYVVDDGKYNFNGECYSIFPPTDVYEAWPDNKFKTVFSNDLDHALKIDYYKKEHLSEEEIMKSAISVMKNYYESFR